MQLRLNSQFGRVRIDSQSGRRPVLTRLRPPMLPSLVREPPASNQMDSRKIKHDGFRTMLVIDGGQVRAFTGNRFDWTDSYRPIVKAAEKLGCQSAVMMAK